MDFGSWSSSPLFFKEVMAPRKWAPKRRFSVVHVGRWLHETLWKWWWSPWGWPLFSLRDRPHHHCAAVCIGGNEGICWLIILNSVYLNLYHPEKVTWFLLNCLHVWSWVWDLWTTCRPLFSLRQTPVPTMCIGGKEGICWLIILNSVYLNLYCQEKVMRFPLNCLFVCLFDLWYGFFGNPADTSSHSEADHTTICIGGYELWWDIATVCT